MARNDRFRLLNGTRVYDRHGSIAGPPDFISWSTGEA
jgi:hypothetical protein